MRNKLAIAFLVMSVSIASAVPAFATPTTTAQSPVDLATTAGNSMRDISIATIAALIPIAVVVLLAKKALPWARKFLHV